MNKDSLILTQPRNNDKYKNFIGRLYHFPKSHLSHFQELPIEFVFYDPPEHSNGEFFGCGKIHELIPDNEPDDNFFAVIKDYQKFDIPFSFLEQGSDLSKRISSNYDSKNIISKIPYDIYNDICLEGGIKYSFKSDSHLIKVLGEQLIGSEKVGILELIKNAIDAQASYCRIRIEKVNNLRNLDPSDYEFFDYEGPVIVIEDNGIGMSLDVLENGWLRPASTLKTNIKARIKKEREKAKTSGNLGTFDALIKQLKKEHGNRIPLGEKGVGRFAAHRLGRYLELKTKTKANSYELVLRIDWNKFDVISDSPIDLDNVDISIIKQNPSRDYGEKESGTQLIIYGGREGFNWDENSIIELNRTILNLNSPNPNKLMKRQSKGVVREVFDAFLECPQINDLPTNQIYEESTPNFSLDVLVNDIGIADYSLEFRHPTDRIPPETWNGDGYDLRITDKQDSDYWIANGKKRIPECGSFYIHMKIWYRKSEWIHFQNVRDLIDLPRAKDLTDYLGEFGGMSVYRDGILIFDAKLGAELDWLKLNEKRIQKASNISYRDFVGSVEIEQDQNIYIVDKTNREGLIRNQAYEDLATLSRNVVENILFPRYKAKRDEFNRLTEGIISNPQQLKNITRSAAKLIGNFSQSNYPFGEDPYSFFAGLWGVAEERKGKLANLENSVKELQNSLKLLEEVQDQFIEQAGFGIAVAISLHEINKIASNFYHSILHIIKSGKFDELKLEEVKETSQSLRTELKRLGPLRSIRNERRTEFNIERTIHYASEIFKRRLNKENIEFQVINPDKGFMVYGRYSVINQVLGNLFDNSIYWIGNASNDKQKIIVKIDSKYRTLIFADSGNDINEIIRPYLFQPGYSLKVPKSGLGLYICKSYLDSMKARIYETPQKDRIKGLSGAHFTLDFGKTPANKENT